MNPQHVKAVYDYIKANPGCTVNDVNAHFANIPNIDSLLEWMSEGGITTDGDCADYIITIKAGHCYPGPYSGLADSLEQ